MTEIHNGSVLNIDYDEIKRWTKKAALIDFGYCECWLPKSQIIIHEEINQIEIPQWLAYGKGLV